MKNTFNYAVSRTNAVILLTSSTPDFPLHVQYENEDIKLGTSEVRIIIRNYENLRKDLISLKSIFMNLKGFILNLM